MNIVEPFQRQALAHPERYAIVVGKEVLSYGQLLSTVEQLALSLHEHGIGSQDRVAVVVKAPAGNIALSLALASVGAVSVGFPIGMNRETMKALAQDFDVSYVIHDRSNQEFMLAYPSFKGQLHLHQLLAQNSTRPRLPLVSAAPHDIWRILISSGTTGTPKGILSSHGATLAIAQLQRVVFPTGHRDRLLIAMAVSMGFATQYWLRALYAGACTALLLDGTAEEALKVLHGGQITQIVTTPATARGMAEIAMKPGSRYSAPPPGLRLMNVGGGQVSPHLWQALRDHVCLQLSVNYGATETGTIALVDPALRVSHPRSAGLLVPWVEAQAVDDKDVPLPMGTEGALRFRSPALCHGYAGNVQSPGQPQPFRDGWFYSNDRGFVTPEGLVFLSGRANDVLNVSGVKVDPERVEAAIAEDSAVVECVVVDVPGSLAQPMLVAVVVASGKLDIDALNERCRNLGRSCVPKLVVRAEKLPRNQAGKIMREEVRRNIRIRRSDTAASPGAPADAGDGQI